MVNEVVWPDAYYEPRPSPKRKLETGDRTLARPESFPRRTGVPDAPGQKGRARRGENGGAMFMTVACLATLFRRSYNDAMEPIGAVVTRDIVGGVGMVGVPSRAAKMRTNRTHGESVSF